MREKVILFLLDVAVYSGQSLVSKKDETKEDA